VSTRYQDFDELWHSFRRGEGPIGAHAASLEGEKHDAVRDAAPPPHRLAGRALRVDRERVVCGRDGLMEQRVSLVTLGVAQLDLDPAELVNISTPDELDLVQQR
jgi:hypothetical protein